MFCLFADLGGDRWLVQTLLDHRISEGVKAGDIHRKGTKLYKVRWAGCTEDDDSWEPMSKIAPGLVRAFHEGSNSTQSQTQPTATQPARAASPPKRTRDPQAMSPSAKSPDPKAQAVEAELVEELD